MDISTLAALVTILFTLGGGIYKLVSLLSQVKKNRDWKELEIKKCLSRLGFTKDEYFEYIQSPLFIPTMGQKNEPHDNDDLLGSDNRFPLVETLIKAISKKNSIEKRRFAILGGSGMGKTTFSASFIYEYIKKGIFKKTALSIYVYYLGAPYVLNEINQLQDEDSILLLDALDENAEAAKDIKAFMNKLELVTNKFKYVILTSRTQFFENKESEPGKIPIIQNNPGKESLTFEVIYISPFSDEETKKFLENKYGIPSNEYSKACMLTEKSKNLMVRPMVLSFVDDLINMGDIKDLTTVELYWQIILEWLERECKNQKDINVSDLFDFSKKLSLFIYNKWVQKSVSEITAQEYDSFINGSGYKANPYSFRGRSLLNRRSDGSIKFAHRSFWEFFLAISSLEAPSVVFNSNGLEMAFLFSKELYELFLNGKNLPFVNIATPVNNNGNSDITDSRLKEILSKCTTIIREKKNYTPKSKKLLLKYFFQIWELLLYRYGMTNETKIAFTKGLTSKMVSAKVENDISSVLELERYIQEINSITLLDIISNVQSCFLRFDISKVAETILSIEDRIKRIKSIFFCAFVYTVYGYKISSDDSLDGTGFSSNDLVLWRDNIIDSTESHKNNIFVLPYIIGLEKDIINMVLSQDNLCIGYGIGNYNLFLKVIEFALNNGKYTDPLYISRDAEDINEYISFVTHLSTNLKELKTRPQLIILRTVINNCCLYYAINNDSLNYRVDETKDIILSMLAAYQETTTKNL